jgi:DNA-binding transcriptional ArsR family regulator
MADEPERAEHIGGTGAAASEVAALEGEQSQIAELLADDDVIYTATQIFDALSDFTRFQILGALSIGERNVTELKDVCHVSQSAISHQLRLLRDRGLVAARREGQRVVYSLADDHVATLIKVGLEHAGHTFTVEEA